MTSKTRKFTAAAAKTAAVAAIAAGAVAVVAPAASAGETNGSCNKDGYAASFSLVYHTSGSFDYPDKYTWALSGSHIGNKNNVEGWVKSVATGSTDDIYHHWKSNDNIHPNAEQAIPSNVKVKRSLSMYASLHFTFDKPDAGDPTCTGRTKSV